MNQAVAALPTLKKKILAVLCLIGLGVAGKGFVDVYRAGYAWGEAQYWFQELGQNMGAATPLFPPDLKSPVLSDKAQEISREPVFVWHPKVVMAALLYLGLFALSLLGLGAALKKQS